MNVAVKIKKQEIEMLGELISEGKGKRTGRRVLAVEPQFLVEVSFEDASTMLGVSGMNIGTYASSNRPDGTLSGSGQGIFATMDGELVTWKGIGTGKLTAGGSVSYRGALTYSTTSTKLARLNSIAGVFEFEVDAAGSTSTKVWAWS
jgi:hypothetical protein